MQPGLFDHLLALVLIVGAPILGLRHHDRLVQAVHQNRPGARRAAYRSTLIQEWVMTFVVLAFWLAAGRSLESIGLSHGAGLLLWIGWAVAVGAVGLLVAQVILAPRRAEGREALRRQLENVRELVPHDAPEARLFVVLSITAGICEEFVYRGFLLAYVDSLLGRWPAVVLSSLVFGLGHAYQGGRGILKTAAVGLFMAILFVLTGGLWAPMLVHAVIDVTSGILARRVLGEEGPTDPEQRPAPLSAG